MFANQKVLLPSGVAVPGPYLSGDPTLKNEIGQARLNETTGIQNYDALQLSVQRRLAKGLEFSFNYGFSKCLTNAMGYYGRYGDSTASQASADKAFQEYAYNLNLDYGLCDHDVTNVFTGYVTYDVPFGRGRQFGSNVNRVVDTILGGWQANAIITLHGGFPLSIYDFSDPSGTGSAEPRPNCIAPSQQTPYAQNPNPGQNGYLWFNPATMAHPAPGTLGKRSAAGRGIQDISALRRTGKRRYQPPLAEPADVREHVSNSQRSAIVGQFRQVLAQRVTSSEILPCCASRSAIAVNCLATEPLSNTVSAVTGVARSRSAMP